MARVRGHQDIAELQALRFKAIAEDDPMHFN